MRINDFIEQFNEKYPDVDRFDVATDDMVALYEETLGYCLPESFVKFLKEFSNIFLLDCEPIWGVSKDSPSGDICKVTVSRDDINHSIFNYLA